MGIVLPFSPAWGRPKRIRLDRTTDLTVPCRTTPADPPSSPVRSPSRGSRVRGGSGSRRCLYNNRAKVAVAESAPWPARALRKFLPVPGSPLHQRFTIPSPEVGRKIYAPEVSLRFARLRHFFFCINFYSRTVALMSKKLFSVPRSSGGSYTSRCPAQK